MKIKFINTLIIYKKVIIKMLKINKLFLNFYRSQLDIYYLKYKRIFKKK